MADVSALEREPSVLLISDGVGGFVRAMPVVLVDNTGARATALPVTTSATLTSRTVTPSSASVTTSSAQVLASNANRKTAIFTNTSDTARVSLGFGATAVLDSGVTLMPGASFSMGSLDFSTAAVTAIASTGTATLSVSEWV